MQEFLDQRIEEIKILTKFEPDKEILFLEMPTYKYYLHLSAVRKHKGKKDG